MKSYKIFRSRLGVKSIEKVLNKLDGLGYEYCDMFEGKFLIFFSRVFIVAKVK